MKKRRCVTLCQGWKDLKLHALCFMLLRFFPDSVLHVAGFYSPYKWLEKVLTCTARQGLHWQKYSSLLLVPEYCTCCTVNSDPGDLLPSPPHLHLQWVVTVSKLPENALHPAPSQRRESSPCAVLWRCYWLGGFCKHWVHLILLCKLLILQSLTPPGRCRGDWEDHQHQWK